jgi:hypothetical protein
VNSAFLVFDLIGRNASLQSEGNARGFIYPEFDDVAALVPVPLQGWT